MQVRNFWLEFKTFAFRGNLIDLAVAVLIGNAFGQVVKSLVDNILMPILSYVIPNGGSYRSWHIGRVEVGPFLAEMIHFLIVALAMFVVVVKLLGAMHKVLSPRGDAPSNKECPYCLSMIPIKAVKCAHCTADLAERPGGPPDYGPIGAG